MIGSAVTVNVGNGTASAVYALPAGTSTGTYTIQAVYNGTTDFVGSTDMSHSLTVNPGAAYQVVFGQQPTDAVAGVAISPAVTVEVEDQYDNVVTTNGSTVTLTLSSGTFEGGSSTVTAVASSGVATFSGLKIDAAGSYTLSAADGVLLPSAPSNSFTISPAAASKLLIHVQPSSGTRPGEPFTTQPVIYEVDRYDNLERSDNSTVVTASLNSGTGPLQGTTTTKVSGGVATFTKLFDDVAETITLKFASPGLSAATTGPLTIAPLPAPVITAVKVVTTQPLNKKGKPKGKPVFAGFTIQYNTAMNPTTAGVRSNYEVSSISTTKKKGKTQIVLSPVKFSISYSQANNTVKLAISGNKNPFSKGGG